jgi:hypothetical protein
MKRKFQMLFSAATEIPSGGSGAPSAAVTWGETEATASAPASEAPAAPAASAPAAPEPPASGIVQRIMSRFEEKTELVTQRDNAVNQLQSVMQERDSYQQQVTDLTAQLAAAQGDLKKISDALDAAEKKNTTVNAAAVDLVAGIGMPAAALPPVIDPPQDSVAALEAKLAASTDPIERQKLALKIKKLVRANA